jgi:hypothetical protein
MPVNNGRKPPHEIVDVILRNGSVIRGIRAAGWRWKPWPDGPSDFDIVKWQKTK